MQKPEGVSAFHHHCEIGEKQKEAPENAVKAARRDGSSGFWFYISSRSSVLIEQKITE